MTILLHPSVAWRCVGGSGFELIISLCKYVHLEGSRSGPRWSVVWETRSYLYGANFQPSSKWTRAAFRGEDSIGGASSPSSKTRFLLSLLRCLASRDSRFLYSLSCCLRCWDLDHAIAAVGLKPIPLIPYPSSSGSSGLCPVISESCQNSSLGSPSKEGDFERGAFSGVVTVPGSVAMTGGLCCFPLFFGDSKIRECASASILPFPVFPVGGVGVFMQSLSSSSRLP